MSLTVPYNFVANAPAVAAEVNANFTRIVNELNAFPTQGGLIDNAISSSHIAAGAVTKAKLAADVIPTSPDDDDLMTKSAITSAITSLIAASVPAYSGGESITIGNLIIKMGYVSAASSWGTRTVEYATPFPNKGLVVLPCGENGKNGACDRNCYSAAGIITGDTDYKTGFVTYGYGSFRWLAIGY